MFKNYYRLTKPGIVYGNVFTTIAGFLFATRWHFGATLFLATIFGIGLVIASACVFNNYIDRDIDKRMERTKNRALVSGTISARNALIYASILGLLGITLLAALVNLLTAAIAFFGFIMYVGFYTYAKRKTHWGAVVGSFSGAVPILVGYTAATDRLDLAGLILFLILVLWQMPHFYAVAMYRLNEYVEAGIPVLPIQKGARVTKVHIVSYIAAYVAAISLLRIFGYAGYLYLAIVLLFGFIWLWRGMQGFKAPDDAKWARKLFLFSLIVLVSFSITLSIASITP